MNDLFDTRTRIWAMVAAIAGVALFLGIEIIEEPDATVGEWLLELLDIVPIVLTSVGMALLFRVAPHHLEFSRQKEAQL